MAKGGASYRLALSFPEPPSLNVMLGYAKAWGKGRKYYVEQQKWKDKARSLLPPQPPATPWERWGIASAHFRLWNPRDPLELIAGLKWAVDLLVDLDWVVDDSPNHLIYVPSTPTQVVDRKNRGAEIEIVCHDG